MLTRSAFLSLNVGVNSPVMLDYSNPRKGDRFRQGTIDTIHLRPDRVDLTLLTPDGYRRFDGRFINKIEVI